MTNHYRTSGGGSANMTGRADAKPVSVPVDAEAAAKAAMEARTRNAHRARGDEDVGSYGQVHAKLASGAFDDPSAIWRALDQAARTIAAMTHKPEEREAEVRRLLADAKRRVNLARAEAGKSLLP